MTREDLELLESLLKNFLTYDVTEDLMLTDDVKRALKAVQNEPEMQPVQLRLIFGESRE